MLSRGSLCDCETEEELILCYQPFWSEYQAMAKAMIPYRRQSIRQGGTDAALENAAAIIMVIRGAGFCWVQSK